MKIFEFYAQIEGVSENIMYHPKAGISKWGRRYSYLYKDPRVSEYQEKLKTDFRQFLSSDSVLPIEHVSKLVSYYLFGVSPERYWVKDLSNFIKITEDAILGSKEDPLLPYDDSMVVWSLNGKIPAKEEFVYVQIGVLTSSEECPLTCVLELAEKARSIL